MIQYSKYTISILVSFFLLACSQQKKQNVLTQEGKKLFEKSGCVICHSLQQETLYGPALDSILNTQIIVIRDSVEIPLKIDKSYIFKAIKTPDYEKNKAYQSKKMPIPLLTDIEIETLTNYLVLINNQKLEK